MDLIVIIVVVGVVVGLLVCILAIVRYTCCRSCMVDQSSSLSPNQSGHPPQEPLLPSQYQHRQPDERRRGQGWAPNYSAGYSSFASATECLPGRTDQYTANEKSHQLSHASGRDNADPNSILSSFGYVFNQDGKLVNTKTGGGFVFKDQQHYERLGLAINEYIYRRLEMELERKKLPAPPGLHRGFYFASDDVTENRNGLLVLIHGTGAVRAGQWSRRLIINHSLESGSQLPYIKQAKAYGWSVVVMNTNQRHDYSECEGWIEGSNPEDHGCAVWEAIVQRSPAKLIGIVAHSYGGQVTSCLLRRYNRDFKDRVAAIALTDSSCSASSADHHYLSEVARNWITSQLPLDRRVGYGCYFEQFSAGTTVHEETSWKSIGPVFSFIKDRFCCRGVTLNTVEGSPEWMTVGQQLQQQSNNEAKRPANVASGSLPKFLDRSSLLTDANPESCSGNEAADDVQVSQAIRGMNRATEIHTHVQDPQDVMPNMTAHSLDKSQTVDHRDWGNTSCKSLLDEAISTLSESPPDCSHKASATDAQLEITTTQQSAGNSSMHHYEQGLPDADASLPQPVASSLNQPDPVESQV